MIDVKTLHIGSHVEYKGKIVRICSLKAKMANYDYGKGKPFYCSDWKAYYKYLHPIPITPELLNELGFEYRDNTYWERWYLGSFTIERKEHSSYLDYDGHIPLKYLHELENLYYMVYGKELKKERL